MKNYSLLYLMVVVMLSFSAPYAQAQIRNTNNKVDSTNFHYREGSILLYDTYKNNASALSSLNRMVAANRPAILAGNAHIELFGYIPSYQVGHNSAINTASIQASVVRSYLKTQYGIPHSASTFAIDTTQGLRDMVQVQLVAGPVPAYANQQINYSEYSSARAVDQAVRSYSNGIPYTSYLMILARRYNFFDNAGGNLYALHDKKWSDQEWDDFADTVSISTLVQAAGLNLYVKGADGLYSQATQQDIDLGVNILYTKNSDGAFSFATADDILAVAKNPDQGYPGLVFAAGASQGLVRTEPYVEGKGELNKGFRDYPIFGLKTNLLKWATALPNLELEFFFGNSFSLNVGGSYTWLSEYLPVEKAYYFWSTEAEFRYWFNPNRQYQHWYIGIYGQIGQYDFKFDEIGNQGDYYGGGLSAGYVLPVGKHFNVEFGLGVGYYKYTNSEYVWNDTRKRNEWFNPDNRSQDKWGIFPGRVKVALVWKF